MSSHYNPAWTAMEDATRADFEAVMGYEAQYNAGLVDRLLGQLRQLDEPWTPYPVNRFQHLLQSATRAYRDGARGDPGAGAQQENPRTTASRISEGLPVAHAR